MSHGKGRTGRNRKNISASLWALIHLKRFLRLAAVEMTCSGYVIPKPGGCRVFHPATAGNQTSPLWLSFIYERNKTSPQKYH